MQELIELMGLDINSSILQKALEKEKEQIIEAYNQGTLDGESGIIFYPDYYFKTYNQNK